MGEDKAIFRKVALERLSTPEQLDQLMEVTSPKGWLALLGMGIILAGVVAWSLFGTIPEKVTGQGVFLTTGGIAKLTAPAGGQMIGFTVREGDTIRAGDLLAHVAQPELAAELVQAHADYDRIRREYEEKAGAGLGEEVRLKLLANVRKREAVNLSTRNLREYVTQLENKIRTQEELLAQGLITPQTLLNAKRELTDAQDKIRQNDIALITIAAEEAELRKTPEGKLEQLLKDLAQADDRLRQATAKLELADRIESPFSGRVVEVFTYEHDRLVAGSPVCTLELTDTSQQRLEAVLFVPAAGALRIKVGMPAMLAPANARREEHGMLLAEVTSVASYPSSQQSITRFINNEALVQAVVGREAAVEVRAKLLPDQSTPSGFAWSSARGCPDPPRSGTLCTTEIVVARQRPVVLVIPALENLLKF